MKIITKIVAVCCLWGLSSCDSYLDVNQPSIYTDQSLYKTPADCEASIAGVYSQLQTVYNRNYLEAIVLREDAIKNMNNNITRFTDTSTEKTWETAWKSFWVLVSRSNKILDNIDRVVFSDEDQKNHIKARLMPCADWPICNSPGAGEVLRSSLRIFHWPNCVK